MGKPKTPKTTTTPARAVKVPLEKIALDNTEMTPRGGPLMPLWIKELVLARRHTGGLEPVLLWKDPDSGLHLILDGRHRIAAYRSDQKSLIPARVIACTRREALLAAARSHSKAQLPLSAEERADFAWRLVREEALAYSKREIAQATAVGERTVARMRARLKEAKQTGEDLTGSWWQDRDPERQGPDREEMTDGERLAAVEQLTKAVRDLLDYRKGTPWAGDPSIVDEAVIRALGEERIRAMAEWSFPTEEDAFEFFGTKVAYRPEEDPHEEEPEPPF